SNPAGPAKQQAPRSRFSDFPYMIETYCVAKYASWHSIFPAHRLPLYHFPRLGGFPQEATPAGHSFAALTIDNVHVQLLPKAITLRYTWIVLSTCSLKENLPALKKEFRCIILKTLTCCSK